MIKILHSADWHLDSPLLFRNEGQARQLRTALSSIPGQILALCRREQCDMMLLSGDLFDGAYAADTLRAFKNMLAQAGIPVFITPGNHDPIGNDTPWLSETWPENVYIFTHPVMEAVDVEALDCCVYGAGYMVKDCPSLLEDFSPTHTERYSIGILHGDPTQVNSPCCPVTAHQVEQSGFHYLALGHIPFAPGPAVPWDGATTSRVTKAFTS